MTPPRARPDALMARAVTFLKPRQAENGAWSADRNEPGISALVVAALLKTRRVAVGDPAIAKGLEYLEQFARPEGGFDGPSRQLHDRDRPDGLSRSQRRRWTL